MRYWRAYSKLRCGILFFAIGGAMMVASGFQTMEQAGNVGGFCGSGQIARITTTPYLARMVLQLVPDANEGDGGLIYVASPG